MQIALVGSATSAWGQVFFGIPFKQGDVILTSQAEYGSNYLAYLQVCVCLCASLCALGACMGWTHGAAGVLGVFVYKYSGQHFRSVCALPFDCQLCSTCRALA